VKRSTSVRRELRFDLPPLPKSPEEATGSEIRSVNKRKFFDFALFAGKKNPPLTEGISPTKIVRKNIKVKSCKLVAKTLAQQQELFVTSTPNNDLDNFLGELNDDSFDGNWKSAINNKFKPQFFSTERYQCNLCKGSFCTNDDLLSHLKDNHSKIWGGLKPNYRCGSCGLKFFRNLLLIRHCSLQHTPIKK
jgi:hypothetical protein